MKYVGVPGISHIINLPSCFRFRLILNQHGFGHVFQNLLVLRRLQSLVCLQIRKDHETRTLISYFENSSFICGALTIYFAKLTNGVFFYLMLFNMLVSLSVHVFSLLTLLVLYLKTSRTYKTWTTCQWQYHRQHSIWFSLEWISLSHCLSWKQTERIFLSTQASQLNLPMRALSAPLRIFLSNQIYRFRRKSMIPKVWYPLKQRTDEDSWRGHIKRGKKRWRFIWKNILRDQRFESKSTCRLKVNTDVWNFTI